MTSDELKILKALSAHIKEIYGELALMHGDIMFLKMELSKHTENTEAHKA